MPGTLYLVATPIGNLQDMSQRAIEILKTVDVIACEDTRHTKKLLNTFNITNKLISYHEHNETARAGELCKMLEGGRSVAVVSDAGTPGINDPGYRIVQKAIGVGVPVISIPGPVAFVNAAVISGLSTDSLFFGGFLPSKKNERRRRLREVGEIAATLLFYESPRRLKASLRDCLEVLGDRKAVVARELTKLHEEVVRGKLTEIIAAFTAVEPRGEIVLVIDRLHEKRDVTTANISLADRVSELVGQGIDRKTALKTASKEFGVSRSEAYRLLQDAKNI
jgi:16S rRNA (cytidine1402-2'-O)-methyltransferase